MDFMCVQVLQHVRLPLLSPKFLVGTVGSDPLIKSDEECRWALFVCMKASQMFLVGDYFWRRPGYKTFLVA